MVVAIAIGVLFVKLTQVEAVSTAVLPMRVWMQEPAAPTPDHKTLLDRLQTTQPTESYGTKLSTQDFWFVLNVGPAFDSKTQVLDFPSRHAVALTCWDADTDALLGNATRTETQGQLSYSRGGFALTPTPERPLGQVLCKGAFRGPAKISVRSWTTDALHSAQAFHKISGYLLEVGIGVLALFMLLTAWVNRSRVYWTFVGWLLLNMRMASLSAGSDWELFGIGIDPSWVIGMRQWTVCLYFSMTVALFSQLFRQELKVLKAGWALAALQMAALLIAAMPLALKFEQTLRVIWPATAVGTAIIVWYLFKILKNTPSRVAGWYAASIAIATLAGLTEVIVAATGHLMLVSGINHVTAAIASALLASLAMAEHMRTDRREKIEAQKTLQAAYLDSPIGLFTVGEAGLLLKTNPAFQSKLKDMAPEAPTHLAQIFEAQIVDAVARLQSPGARGSVELQTKVKNSQTRLDHWFSIKASTTDGTV
ncbi:MAG: hypothetical protein ACOVOD_09680, partial [Rhodoferax sp.]